MKQYTLTPEEAAVIDDIRRTATERELAEAIYQHTDICNDCAAVVAKAYIGMTLYRTIRDAADKAKVEIPPHRERDQ